jgi:hypothetical protein
MHVTVADFAGGTAQQGNIAFADALHQLFAAFFEFSLFHLVIFG